ncbi:hypothetical protein HPB48_008909 [Haemaphysalis longicornis]|uniref:HEAT repeat-containing protein n=1 Tax=Haemaphysalis longicornis TaxID=44386 RepID=A0A9J6FT51_HAELO|nr:hypothetical protein HPB48_008909 [Haemaphysalis longicornis]
MADSEENADAEEPPSPHVKDEKADRGPLFLALNYDIKEIYVEPQHRGPQDSDAPASLRDLAALFVKKLLVEHFKALRRKPPSPKEKPRRPPRSYLELLGPFIELEEAAEAEIYECLRVATTRLPFREAALKVLPEASEPIPSEAAGPLGESQGSQEQSPQSEEVASEHAYCSHRSDNQDAGDFRQASSPPDTVSSPPCSERPREEPPTPSSGTTAEAGFHYPKHPLDELVDLCYLVIGNREAPSSLHRKYLQALMTVAECPPSTTHVLDAKRLSQLAARLVEFIALGIDPTATRENQASENSLIATEALLSLIHNVKGTQLVPAVAGRICTLIQNQDCRRRCGALAVFNELCQEEPMPQNRVSVNCAKVLVGNCLRCVLQCLKDRDNTVRGMAITAVEQASLHIAPEYAQNSHRKIVPELLGILTKRSQADVIAVAATMLRQIFVACTPDVVVTYYMGAVLCKLDKLCEESAPFPPPYVALAEHVLQIVALMSDLAQDNFLCVYDDAISLLKKLITSFDNTNKARLWWLALYCVARIGIAVGTNQFLADVPLVKGSVVILLAGNWYHNDDYILGKAMSIALMVSRALDYQCEDFMGYVLPSVFHLFSQHNTTLVTFHVRACALLETYSWHAHRSFMPYANDALHHLLPLLVDPAQSVRTSAAECLPRMLACSATCGVVCATNRWLTAHSALTAAIEQENNISALLSQVCALEQMLHLVWLPCILAEDVGVTASALDKCFEFYFRWNCVADIDGVSAEKLQFGAKEGTKENDMHRSLLQELADIMCTLITQLKDRFFSCLDRLVPLVSKMLTKPRPWTEHLYGLQIFGDVLSLGPAGSVRYSTYYLPEIFQRLESSIAPVRAAAARAVATIADVGGSTFTAQCIGSVPCLAAAIADPESHFPEDSFSTDLSLVAMAVVFERYWERIQGVTNMDELFQRFLSWLPVLEGRNTERPLQFLCSLVEKNDAVAMANAASIAHVLADARAKNHVDEGSTLGKRVAACLRRQTQTVLKALSETLSGGQRQAMQGFTRPPRKIFVIDTRSDSGLQKPDQQTSALQQLRPILFSLYVLGLYSCKQEDTEEDVPWFQHVSPWTCVVLALLCAYVMASVASCVSGLFWVSAFSFLKTASALLSSLALIMKEGALCQLIWRLNELPSSSGAKLRRTAAAMVACVWAFVLLRTSVQCVMLFEESPEELSMQAASAWFGVDGQLPASVLLPLSLVDTALRGALVDGSLLTSIALYLALTIALRHRTVDIFTRPS